MTRLVPDQSWLEESPIQKRPDTVLTGLLLQTCFDVRIDYDHARNAFIVQIHERGGDLLIEQPLPEGWYPHRAGSVSDWYDAAIRLATHLRRVSNALRGQ